MPVGPTTRRRKIAAELARLRDSAGMTLEAAGEAAGTSRTTVMRYEGTEKPVRWVLVDALCRAYEASDQEREALVALAKEAKVQGWWQTYSVPEWIKPLVTLEAEAVEELHWAPTYVPGLLQTRDYATAVLRAAESRADEDEIASMVDFRMKRQEVLARESPPHLWVIMDESVIRRETGGYEVMAGQLEHLLQSSRTPYVTLQVLPFTAGAHAADSTGYIILRGPEPAFDVVHLSNLSGALYLEKDEELERHRLVFDELRALALSKAESYELIAAARDQFTAAAQ